METTELLEENIEGDPSDRRQNRLRYNTKNTGEDTSEGDANSRSDGPTGLLKALARSRFLPAHIA